MGETVASDKESRARREDPEEEKVEDSNVVAEVKKEIVPVSLPVYVDAERKEVGSNNGVSDVYPSNLRVLDQQQLGIRKD